VEDEARMALLLGRSVDSVEGEVGDRVDECVMEKVRKWRQKRFWCLVEVSYYKWSPPKAVPPDCPQQNNWSPLGPSTAP